MSFCPGYLAITINDLQDAEELFRYDALIFCPTTFNMSFKVPNRGQKPDRTFEIRLEDAKKSYRQVQTLMLKLTVEKSDKSLISISCKINFESLRSTYTVNFFLIATAIPLIATNGLSRTQWTCLHCATAINSPANSALLAKIKHCCKSNTV